MNTSGPAEILLVIPCFQESTRLPSFLPALCETLAPVGGVSVLVVEDGGGGEEQARIISMIAEWRGRFPFLLPPLLLKENLGKGGAVYAGWEQNKTAAWLAFVDADGSVPPAEVVRLIALARAEGTSLRALFASRVKMLGRRIHRLFKRHLLGRIYATLVSELLDIPVYDSQCGLKLVPAAAFARVCPLLSVKGFAFDAELLLALLRTGTDVIEVPIDWHETPGGKIRLIRDPLHMARDVWRIRAAASSAAWRRAASLRDQ